MYLERIELKYFRNYIEEEIKFDSRKIIILGDNAQGKSNLLEAIQFLSTLKSYRTSKDQDLVYRERTYGQIIAQITRKYIDYKLKVKIPNKGRKELEVNQDKILRQIDFLGVVNTVSFSSLDIDLVRGNPEYRRNWIDNLLTQLEPVYAYISKQYNQVLKQRNALLKQLKKRGENNAEQLSHATELQLNIWNEKLIDNACRVMRRRARVLDKLEPLAKFWHQKISNQQEKLQLQYLPNIQYEKNDIEEIKKQIAIEIENKRQAELALGSTLVGPHRDDINLIINGIAAKNYGSQGQQRTLVLALKLGELQLIEEVIGEPPLLLLDDVMAELDLNRQQQLLESLGDRFQTLITTTHLNHFDTKLLQEAQIFKVEKGKLTPQTI